MESLQRKYFGTDGIRGVANQGPLSMPQVMRLGEVTAQVLARQLKRPARIGIGWDTRISSPAMVAALSAGLASGGAHVWRFGVIPTPAVSDLICHYRLDTGIVVSASHNPAADNGIKYFAATGGKFPDASEALLERGLQAGKPAPVKMGTEMGPISDLFGEAVTIYTQGLIKKYSRNQLSDLTVVADLANGATCRTAPRVLDGLKVLADFYHDQPNGFNINVACGSTHPEFLRTLLRKKHADIGLAFDGDGDRVICIDEKGAVVNGDRMLGILAVQYARQGRLAQRAVVSTVMSNLGLELYLKAKKIHLFRAAVGDRYVAEMMRKQHAILGGEQSGHILLPKISPTGDGLLTALEIMATMRITGKPLSELAGGWSDFPQLLVNIPVKTRPSLTQIPTVVKAVRAAEKMLGDRGRVNLRYSGTENLARVMIEAETREAAQTWAHAIGDAIEKAIGNKQRRIVTWLTCV